MLKKSDTDIGGTCLQGYVTTTYAKLVETFGEPTHDGDGYKVDAEWVLSDRYGNVVTIYNYKDGVNYLGEKEGTPVEEITEWHIGGRQFASRNANDLVREALPTAKVRKEY